MPLRNFLTRNIVCEAFDYKREILLDSGNDFG